MHCLWCNTESITTLSWQQLVFLSEPTKLCDTCVKNLHILHGPRCQMCSRQSEERICPDCYGWREKDDALILNYSVFGYNDMMQKMLTRWKYRGDYILGKAFATVYQKTFKKFFSSLDRDTVIVPIPLSDERLKERGFNQAQMLADFLPLQNHAILDRIHTEKQSKKTRHERLKTENPFKNNQPMSNEVILIDDMYTTGTTLRHAATTLKKGGATNVFAYTLIRG